MPADRRTLSEPVAALDAEAQQHGEIEPAEFPSRPMRAMYAFWDTARGREAIPPASRIDPIEMPRFALPFLVLLGVEGRQPRFRARVVGTAVVEAVGADQTGQYVDEVPGTDRQIRRFRWCAAQRRPYYAVSPLTFSPRDYKSYSVLGLPFAGPADSVSRLLFVLHFD